MSGSVGTGSEAVGSTFDDVVEGLDTDFEVTMPSFLPSDDLDDDTGVVVFVVVLVVGVVVGLIGAPVFVLPARKDMIEFVPLSNYWPTRVSGNLRQ